MGSLAHCWHNGLPFTITFYLLLAIALLPTSLADSPDNYKLSGPVIVFDIFFEKLDIILRASPRTRLSCRADTSLWRGSVKMKMREICSKRKTSKCLLRG